MKAYYNEWDSYCAQWLRNLISSGLIPAGDVDERSISDVRADDLRGYGQCHFFAGIGGWPYALRLAEWPEDKPVWSGSCPCQPLSCAGNRKGHADERHLWPAFFRLISECKPATIFGEQVAGKDGREWLAAVRADLEGIGYAVGAADLCAASVGAPHIRQRLFFVADSKIIRSSGWPDVERTVSKSESKRYLWSKPIRHSEIGSMEHAALEQVGLPGRAREQRSSVGELEYADRDDGFEISDISIRRRRQNETEINEFGTYDFWSDIEWITCQDNKRRPIKPGLFTLAHGVSARVGRLRAAGNAIVPQVAAEFIAAAMECMP